MKDPLPNYYFRVRDNGASVFRLTDEARTRRLDMEPIAFVNLRNGEIRPAGARALTETDIAQIDAWREARLEQLRSRALDDVVRLAESLGETAHWAQSRASDEELAAVSDALLMAMHDLRSVLVRKKTDRLG